MQEKIEARDARLHEMIELARVRPERTWRSRSKPLMRIDLQESSVLRTDPGGSPALASGHHTPGMCRCYHPWRPPPLTSPGASLLDSVRRGRGGGGLAAVLPAENSHVWTRP